jgi:hypothetical protein
MSWKKIVLVVAVLLAIALAMHYGRRAGDATTIRAPAPVPVEVARATRGDIELSLKLVGRVEAWSTVSLRARVSGQLESLSFKPGALVRKGSVLAQIDPRLLQAQLDQARGSVARDQALLQKAQADQRRYADMLGTGFVSKADYDLYKANLAVALLPSTSSIWPSVTTFSPAFRPLSITVRPALVGPVVTARCCTLPSAPSTNTKLPLVELCSACTGTLTTLVSRVVGSITCTNWPGVSR